MQRHTTLDGKIVLVTGATGGLGPAVAREIAAAGAHLALANVKGEEAEALAREIGDARGFGADLISSAEAVALVDEVERHVCEIDGLVQLAGGYTGGRVEETEPATWERMLDLNLRTSLHAIRAVLPGMLARGRGKIVTVGSRVAFETPTDAAAYTVAKTALLKLTEVLAAEVRSAGLQVNAVCPSTIDTPANRRAMPGADFDSWVQPRDIARAIVFLLENDAITGEMLRIDGRA